MSDALEWNVCDETEPPPAGVNMKDKFVFISDDNCSTLEQANRIQVPNLT